jgi:hypothetical protein
MKNKIFIISILFISNVLADYNATKNANDLNIYLEDYNQLMALSGLFIGFVILFFSVFIGLMIIKK